MCAAARARYFMTFTRAQPSRGAAQLWALAAPGARAADEHFLSQVYLAELALRLEAPAGGAVLAATTGPDTFSVLLEARALPWSIRRLGAAQRRRARGSPTGERRACDMPAALTLL